MKDGIWSEEGKRRRKGRRTTREDPGVQTPGVGRQRGEEEEGPQARRRAAAPAGVAKRSGSPAEKRHGPWVGFVEVCPLHPQGIWS